MSELIPKIGSWYRNREDGRLFEIVAMDEDDGTIEIQYFESEIEELDTDTWEELSLDLTAAPEDWSGPYDDLISDDMGDTEDVRQPEKWTDPLNEIE